LPPYETTGGYVEGKKIFYSGMLPRVYSLYNSRQRGGFFIT